MRHAEVVIVGGGPGGSTCARVLAAAGASVLVVDRARFPRDKVCAGWITPRVVEALALDPLEYRAAGLVMQDVTGFRTSVLPVRHHVATHYDAIVSYAIRRCEFDAFLLRRSGADVMEGVGVETVRREGDRWILNDDVAAQVLVGAGGQFCPVARHLNPPSREGLVVAKEIELPLGDVRCDIDGREPELYFCRDLDGYGWCVRKGNYLNVGFGRRSSRDFLTHVREFAEWLRVSRGVPARALDWAAWRGHAYRLRGVTPRVAAEDVLLVGDAAGLAWPESGEGIAPAVESGLAAALLILAGGGRVREGDAHLYAQSITAAEKPGLTLPAPLARTLLRVPAVARYALDRWFLRTADTRPHARAA